MTMYLGDIAEDATIRFTWNTYDGSGASITRATNGTVSVYKDGGLTQTTVGVTDTEDFDTLTGVHLCAIDTSADAFYAIGSDYSVVLSGATIDGQSVNATLAEFSIENRFADVNVVTVSGTGQTANDNGADINQILTDIGALNDLSAAQVNTEMVDVLSIDTVAEMAQGAPPLAPTIEQILNYLYREIVRNKVVIDTNTANQKQVFADNDSTILYEKDLTNASDVTTIAKAITGL